MRLRNTILLIITAIATTGSVNAAKQCMPCPAGKWSIGGKCEQDCEQGYYCQAGARVACIDAQYCPPGSSSPQNCPAGHTCYNGIPLFDAISAPMGGCKDETFSFAGDYRIVVNGGRGGSLSKAIGGYGASITMDIRVKKAGLSYNLCAGGNGGAGGQSCTTYTSTCTSGPSGEKEHYSCEKQNCTPASGAGGASSIGFGGGTGCNKNNNCGGNGGGNYGGAGGDGYSSSGGSGGGAASALYIGGAAIAIAGGGGGADGENQAKYSGGSAANYNVPDPSGWGLHTSAGGGGGASKVPAKGSGTSDYEILEVSVGTSAGGSASMSGIRPDSK